MNGYTVEFAPRVEKDLRKLDRPTQILISKWIKKNLVGCQNPRALGKPLKGTFAGMWRYRIGDVRILSRIDDEKIVILIVTIGHRKDVYRKK